MIDDSFSPGIFKFKCKFGNVLLHFPHSHPTPRFCYMRRLGIMDACIATLRLTVCSWRSWLCFIQIADDRPPRMIQRRIPFSIQRAISDRHFADMNVVQHRIFSSWHCKRRTFFSDSMLRRWTSSIWQVFQIWTGIVQKRTLPTCILRQRTKQAFTRTNVYRLTF